METKRPFRVFCVILAVLSVCSAVYTVLQRALIAMVERLAPSSIDLFLRGSSLAQLLLFIAGTGVCLVCAALFSRGRLRAALFVLAAGQGCILSCNLLSTFIRAYSMQFSLAAALLSACCTLVGYGLLAHAVSELDLRVTGWLAAILTGANQLCSALSVFSALMMDAGSFALWFTLFVKTAQISSVLSIIASVLQAFVFLLLLFAAQRAAAAPALPTAPQQDDNPPQES